MFWVIYKIFLFIAVFELGVFLYSLKIKRQDVADVLWGPTFILIALAALFIAGTLSITSIITTFLVIIWGSRLALHIGRRRKGKSEDRRYVELTKDWGEWFYLRSFLQTFLLQGALAIMVSLPVIIIITEAWNITTEFLLGLLVWIFGFGYEAVADKQLRNFVAEGKKGILKTGLWRFSRHPNYFGEITIWWGIFLMALGTYGSWQLAIVGPLTITILICFVSGIPMLEKHYESDAEYQEYKKETSALIPWWKLKS